MRKTTIFLLLLLAAVAVIGYGALAVPAFKDQLIAALDAINVGIVAQGGAMIQGVANFFAQTATHFMVYSAVLILASLTIGSLIVRKVKQKLPWGKTQAPSYPMNLQGGIPATGPTAIQTPMPLEKKPEAQ